MKPIILEANKPILGHGEFAEHTGCVVLWISPDTTLPDDDQTVLVHLEDGEIWTGFRDAGQWRFVSGDRIEAKVKHWAPFPEPPTL